MSNNNLYASHSIRNTLNLLIKHSEGFNDKTDLKKAKTRIINDFNLMKLMWEELITILNYMGDSASMEDLRSLKHYLSTYEDRVKNAKDVETLSEVIDVLNYYKDLSKCSEISIPYFMEAKAKYNELIKSNKDVNYYFKKIVERG